MEQTFHTDSINCFEYCAIVDHLQIIGLVLIIDIPRTGSVPINFNEQLVLQARLLFLVRNFYLVLNLISKTFTSAPSGIGLSSAV